MTENNQNQLGSRTGGRSPRVVIVGAGISGLCLAIKLKRAGIESFQVLEKSHDVGGTWLDNTYPGCACDVPSVLYSYSFASKHDWSRKYPPQSEILEYFRSCVDRYGIRPYIRFGTAVESARFDETESVWRIRTDDGEELVADVFICAVGQLSRPKIPDIADLESFHGEAFHSARWNHDFDVDGRDIAVIGNGASAIQLIPQLARTARKVFVFQRSPNWIAQRHDYRYAWPVQQVFRWVPGAARLFRWWTFLMHEWRINLYKRRGFLNKGFTRWLRNHMRRKVPANLHADVIPQYPAGCKRVLLSNDYLETLHRDNVEVITKQIRGVDSGGVVTKDGTTPVDAIVFATGFESNRFLYPMEITGRGGVNLHDLWKVRPTTYLGMMSAGFPNFFMLYGPNTNLGHNSIIFMIECQVRFIVQCLKTIRRQGAQTIEVRETAVEEFDRTLQEHLREKVWNGYVTNWYKTADGHIVNNWCRSTVAYWWQTRRPDERAFQFSERAAEVATELPQPPVNVGN